MNTLLAHEIGFVPTDGMVLVMSIIGGLILYAILTRARL